MKATATRRLGALVLITGAAIAQEAPVPPAQYPRDIDSWVEHDPPLPSEGPEYAMWCQAVSNSLLEWRVFLQGGKVCAEQLSVHAVDPGPVPPFKPETKEFRVPTSFCQVDDGWLVGFDHGEFGGALYWFSADGARNYCISDKQVVAFVRTPDDVLAIEGVSHKSRSRGSLLRIAKPEPDGRWFAPTLLTLPSAPNAVARRDDGTLFIVLYDGVVAVDSQDRMRVLYRETDGPDVLQRLWPGNCVLEPDGQHLDIGMRQFVGRVSLDSGRLQLLLPAASALNRLPPDEQRRIRDAYVQRPNR